MTASNLYILGPGQGAQVIGMGKSAFEKSAAARAVIETANRVLGFDLSAICFGGPEERLNQTDISQPAIYTVSIASFAQAIESGMFDAAAVTAYAGLSLGEYTALHLAGVFGFEDGLKLVAKRGRYMQDAATAAGGGMVALLGADEAVARKLCSEAAGSDVLVPANFNAPGQIVVSGSAAACQRFTEAATAAGLKAMPLKVAGAFHSPLMQVAADKIAAELAAVTFAPAKKTVYSNVTAQPHTDVESMKKRLVEQIVNPVRWDQTMQTLVGGGAARYIELSPGRTLAGLAKRIDRRLPVECLE
jgi:[acyl-carrier-protein] S-malonyltransferase